ncbi:MAG: T9SS type A sorting domain-containing protein [Bacteroidia bacterium]
MKLTRLLSFVAAVSFGFSLMGQAPHIPLVEHFTNTLCSRCPPSNRVFFGVLDSLGDDVLHIAYHSRTPYTACVFYQHNRTQADARRDRYSVGFTPQAMLNGTFNGAGASMLSTNQAQTASQGGSPIRIDVQSRWLPGDTLEVGANVHFEGELPAGNFSLFVALVEQEIAYNAPNGESEHRNVFRSMLSGDAGEAIPSLAAGMSTGFYSWKIAKHPDWDKEEMKAIAFVQNPQTSEIINAGSDGKSQTTSIGAGLDPGIRIAPNPAHDQITINWAAQEIPEASLEILDMQGRTVKHIGSTTPGQSLNIQDIPQGIYLLSMRADGQVWSKRIVVQ